MGLALCVLGSAGAADAAPATRRATVVRTQDAPRLDGRLDDPVWQLASPLEPLVQVEPVEGGTPSERTEVRLLHDGRHLYLGVRCFDREPDKIVAKEMLRDRSLTEDDRIALVFDTYLDRRNAFFFQINPNGARRDALIENNRVFIEEWDGIWSAKARRDDQGWVAEVRIPFSTFSFDPKQTSWGFNFLRSVRRRDETDRWTAADLDRSFIDVSEVGILDGLSDLDAGRGIDFRPSQAVSYERDRPDDERGVRFDPGFDLFFRMTPTLKGVLTVNPDFSDAPVDDRRVNLTRFNLFFPETRDFFLEDAGIFEFGDLTENGRPFFSRRIGLSVDGDPVPIRLGARVTGRVGPVSLGLLDVQQGRAAGIDSKNLTVARARVDVLERSSVGFILTAGDPGRNDDAGLAGLDFRYRNDRVRGGKVLTGDAWLMRNFETGHSHQQWATGARVAWPNDRWNWAVGMREFGENFRPALGFVNRVDVREYRSELRFRERGFPERANRLLRTVDTGFNFLVITDLDSAIESADLRFDWVEVRTESNDRIRLRSHVRRERLDAPFEISAGVFLGIGEEDFLRHEVFLASSPTRRMSADLRAQWGRFFGGDRLDLEVVLELRPIRNVFLSLEAEQNRVRLPEGDFEVRLGRIRLDLMFTTEISWTTVVQYDNVSDAMGINSRVRWIVAPERELIFVVNQGFQHGDGRPFHSTVSQLIAKIQWSFRF